MSDLTYKVLNTDGTITVYDKAAEIDSQLTDIQTYVTVAGSGTGDDTYACDIGNSAEKNFAIAIANTDAKIITFANVPTRCEVFLEITTSAVGSVTWTLDGGTLAWSTGAAPTLASGKIYRILFLTNDGGTTWDGFASVGV